MYHASDTCAEAWVGSYANGPSHYQLRHFISSPEQDLLYYASGADIYCLNSATKTQAHVTTLPWTSRCTASGHGYVCVGGEIGGNFAAIKVAGFPPSDPADIDSRLDLDLGRRTTVPRAPILGAAHRVQLEKIGEDIVNSIHIHKFPAEGDGDDEVVAVLTNNDRTVRVYSLTWNLEIAVLDLPFPMNHASISPDGKLLVAVGDRNVAFFFERVEVPRPSSMKTPEGRTQTVPPEWSLLEEVNLYIPPGGDNEGYFTTAWSPSSRLCAVGSEAGYITIFDIELLKISEYGEDAIIRVISSTRAERTCCPGSVRTMLFSPAPWDFLVWSEEQGRVCVSDLRSGLKVRQVLNLDPKGEDVEKVEVADFDIDLALSPELDNLRRESDFIRNYRRALDSEGAAAAVNFASNYIEASSDRRNLHRRLGVVESDDDPHGLTAQEREILEALRTTRQREEGREPGTTPRSINYTSASSERRRRLVTADDYSSRLRGETRTTESAALETRPSTVEERNRIRSWRRVSNPEGNGNTSETAATRSPSTRAFHQDYQARLAGLEAINRHRLTLARGASAAEAPNANGNLSEDDSPAATSPIPPTAAEPRSMTAQAVASTENAWRTIEEALARNARAGAANLRGNVIPEPRIERRLRQLTQMRERLRNAREGQPLVPPDSFYSMGGFRRAGRVHDPSFGLHTAGVAMSPDGHTLYCGTTEGIFEYKINLHERKGLPAITPR